ncbi:MAG TPA: PilX N-terminal domain-containing pilus assembly protein [Pseudomonadales bacterium]|nr:PilX N-terminal domain-containing pilus assembly protein [Pseudomonadales bacterium]
MADRLQSTFGTPARQRGIILLVSLILLLILTVMGLASMGGSLLEARMTGHYRDQELAIQSAEAALREGERTIHSSSSALLDARIKAGGNSCTGGYCQSRQFDTGHAASLGKACHQAGHLYERWELPVCDSGAPVGSADVWNNAGRHLTYGANLPGVRAPARYIIELAGLARPATAPPGDCAGHPLDPANAGCQRVYRITALAGGGTDRAQVMLQSTYVK